MDISARQNYHLALVRSVEINAAAHFWGYTDEWPDAEMTESLQRAREALAAGIAQLAIEKARHCGWPERT
jgi:hypothetical protein